MFREEHLDFLEWFSRLELNNPGNSEFRLYSDSDHSDDEEGAMGVGVE
jgi:hypothetical protein